MNWTAGYGRLSVAFTLAVMINIVAMVQEKSAFWVRFLVLLPLGLPLVTGLTLLVLPYAVKRRDAVRIGE
ncbi:hypothetical protein GA0061105_101199 [Rhizobium aethiopicum]|uniref:Uncharacterized protein n=2 Tax=Rhizobium TaxID=379 RepID=A0A1C3XVV4_9HYPH|nr:hypothetical protein [Rhizobium aethiopicum]SCB56371.1 hypothetical protein GA0061105_101199 [Rhizobium aethiopicum]